jgi:diguanylate cyclase (GGDEF)-like protein
VTEGQREDCQVAKPSAPNPNVRGISSWTQQMDSIPLPLRIVLSIALLACVGLLEFASGVEIDFSVFYLVPVLFAGGFVSRQAGRYMAIASAATWGCLDIGAGHVHSAAWIPVWNSLVRFAFFLIINELVNTVRLAHMRERELARTDSLTGLANLRVFEERAHQVISQHRRDGRPFTLTYVDLDRFKHVNDRFGHAEGYRLLRRVATNIQVHLRVTDVVARLGGDEFGILMPETGAEQAREALERIVASLAREVGERWGVGATFGAVTFHGPPDDADAAVRLADDLMYRGKVAGRGRILHELWPESAADGG